MKALHLALILTVIAVSSALAAPRAKYTLYFVDNTRNVCRLALDAAAKPMGKPVKLTSGGGYDGFSVSPDEKKLVGFTAIKKEFDKDLDGYRTTWKCFIEQPAVKKSRKMVRMLGPLTGAPAVSWSQRGSYFMMRYGYTDIRTDVYRFAGGQKIITDSTMPAVISPNERYIIMENKYPLKPSGVKVADLKTEKFVEFSERGCPAIWIGGSPKIAWIDSGSVFTGAIVALGGEIKLVGQSRLSTGSYDLRYVPGKGLYFLMGDSRTDQLGCYSQDLKTITQGEVLPERPDRWQAAIFVKKQKGLIADDAVFSPDGLFVAFSAGTGKPSQVIVLDGGGKSVVAATGRSPQWKGPDSLWSPWQQVW